MLNTSPEQMRQAMDALKKIGINNDYLSLVAVALAVNNPRNYLLSRGKLMQDFFQPMMVDLQLLLPYREGTKMERDLWQAIYNLSEGQLYTAYGTQQQLLEAINKVDQAVQACDPKTSEETAALARIKERISILIEFAPTLFNFEESALHGYKPHEEK